MKREDLQKRDIVDNLDECIKSTYKLNRFRHLLLDSENVKERQSKIIKYLDKHINQVAKLLDVIKEQKQGFLRKAKRIDKEGFKIDMYNIRDMWTKILKPNDLKRDEPIDFNTVNKVLNENKDNVKAHILKSNSSIYSSLDDEIKMQTNENDTIDKIIPDKSSGDGLIQAFGKGLWRLAKAYWEVNKFFFNLIYAPLLSSIKEHLIGSADVKQEEKKEKFRGEDDWYNRETVPDCHIDPPCN